jgi:hypothetical protein
MTARILRARLVAVVGEYEAQELLEAPNFALGGRCPIDLLDSGNFRPIEIMLRDMEAREASRRDFMSVPHHDVDEIDMELEADPILDRIPQRRHSRGAGRIFAILDQLEKGGSK